MLTLALAIPVLVTPEGTLQPGRSRAHRGLGGEQPERGAATRCRSSGVWPSIDFRDAPHLEPLVLVLAAACLLARGAARSSPARGCPAARGLPFAVYVGGAAIGGTRDHGARLAVGRRQGDGDPLPRAAGSGAGRPGAARAAPPACGSRRWSRPRWSPGVVAWSAFLAYQGTSGLRPATSTSSSTRSASASRARARRSSTDASFYGVRHFLSDLDAGVDDRSARRARSCSRTGRC